MSGMERYADTVLTEVLNDGTTLQKAIDEIRAFLMRLAEVDRLAPLHEPLLDALRKSDPVVAAEAAWAYLRDTSEGSPFQRSNGLMWAHLMLAGFFDSLAAPVSA